MNFRRGRQLLSFAILVFASILAAPAQQQASTPEGTMTNSRQAAGPPVPLSTIPAVTSARSSQQLQQQHDALVADTVRLASLVDQLRLELLSTSAGTLSATSLKKAGEIEKLSRSIRKKLQS